MPLFRRRNSAQRMKARRYERRWRRRTDMRPRNRLTSGPISVATKLARKKLQRKGFYKAIGKMREDWKLPKFTTGVVEADQRVISAILEAATMSSDPAAFAQAYIDAAPEYLGTDQGLAAMQFEAWVAENADLADKFVETVVEPDKETFTAIFVGNLSDADWNVLDKADFVTMRALLEAGDRSYETGMSSDITIFECSSDIAAFQEDDEFEEFDPDEVRADGGLTHEAFEFLAGAAVSEDSHALHGQTWCKEGDRWYIAEATMPSLVHIQDDPKAVAAALIASVDWPAKWNGDEWANSATLRMKHLKKGAGVAAELAKLWGRSNVSKPTVRGWIVSMGVDGAAATKMLEESTDDPAAAQKKDAALEKARTIQKQIGAQALFMLGAKNLYIDHGQGFAVGGTEHKGSGRPSFGFKVGKNEKGVTHVRVFLDPSDTYTVEFLKVRGTNSKPVSKISDVYATDLRTVLSDGTGMYTSLGTMGKGAMTHGAVKEGESANLDEKAPAGWEGTVRAMKQKHGDKFGTGPGKINPYAIAHAAAKKGYKPHYKVAANGKAVPKIKEDLSVDEATAVILSQHMTLVERTTSAMVGGFSADVMGKVDKVRKLMKKKGKTTADLDAAID